MAHSQQRSVINVRRQSAFGKVASCPAGGGAARRVMKCETRVANPGGFDALSNPFAFPDRCRAARRSPGGIRAIADQLSVVRQSLQNGEFINILLFHKPCAVHDDAVRNWRLLLRKSVLSRADGAGRQASVRSRRVRRLCPAFPPIRPDIGADHPAFRAPCAARTMALSDRPADGRHS